MMRHATLYRYRLPLVAGAALRDRRLTCREGLLLRLCADGASGWGEIAPLPGFSLESLAEAEQAARQWLADWLTGEPPACGLPSVAWGTSMAQAELAGTLPTALSHSVPLCHGDPDALFARLAGVPLAKMKVGLYEAVRDGMLVTLLLEALPQLRLRLDANRSWTPERARQFARYVPPALRARIAFIEEPCHSPAASREFARQSGIAIGWDESGREPGFALQAEPGVAALVIKPMLVGSLAQVTAQVAQARAAGLEVVISAAIESSLGLTQLSRLAAWLTPETPPGLDTLSMMNAQLLRVWPGTPLPLWGIDQLEVAWQG